MQLQENLVVADRFRLIRMIGRGGMGSVWQAMHISLDQLCAVKFIEGELANVAEAHARFEREAKAAAQLRSPHVVQILDHGVWQGTPYIAMELLDGEDLGKALAKAGGKLSPGQLNTIIQQVCRALTKAHQAGIVHRDLKPDNIFLVNDDDRQLVKILDFGVAKQTLHGIDGSNTKTGAMLGTPYYMSPEQAQGIKGVDSRSDLWSLAVIVYQCITGQLPFESEALGDLLVKIIVQPIPVPSQVAQVPLGFDLWWAKAADRNPDNRFPSAKEFASSLAVALGTSSVTDVGAQVPQNLHGTAVMHNVGSSNPLPFNQTPAPNHFGTTPHPNNPTPHGMALGPHTPANALSSPNLGGTGNPATFSGVEPPVTLPKKGPPLGILAGVAGFVLLGIVGVGLLVGRRPPPETAAASSPPPPTAVSVATATPAPSDSPPVSAQTPTPPPPVASSSETPTTPPSATVAATPVKQAPVHGGGAGVKPTSAATATTAKSTPSAAPAATVKKWNPGF